MVEHPDIHPPPDDQPDVDRFAALADAPVTALGLSSSAAAALEQALAVKSVRDLADNKYVRRAQAIVHLANEKDSR
jgi:pantoate kinase